MTENRHGPATTAVTSIVAFISVTVSITCNPLFCSLWASTSRCSWASMNLCSTSLVAAIFRESSSQTRVSIPCAYRLVTGPSSHLT